MSYVHCPSCSHAFNLASQPMCPACGTRELAVLADPVDAIVAAAEQLARAMARATSEQLAIASAAMDRRWRVADDTQPSILHAIRGALRPAPEPVVTGPAKHALLATVVMAVLTRIGPRKPVFGLRQAMTQAARALLTR
jgi:hypothetical protein